MPSGMKHIFKSDPGDNHPRSQDCRYYRIHQNCSSNLTCSMWYTKALWQSSLAQPLTLDFYNNLFASYSEYIGIKLLF